MSGSSVGRPRAERATLGVEEEGAEVLASGAGDVVEAEDMVV